MSCSGEDAAVLLKLLPVPAPFDKQTLLRAPDDPLPTLRRGVTGLRLAVLAKAERSGIDGEVLAAYDASVEMLAKLGARIVEVALPHRFGDFAALTGRIIGAEGYATVADIVDDMDLPPHPAVRPPLCLRNSLS